MILREIKTAFSSEVPIVDNEISNNISAPKGQPWRYEEGDIICCGVFYGNKINIFLREKEDNIKDFRDKLREILDKLPTMYAFNFNMEKGNFKGFLGKSYFIEEIKPFKGKGWSKDKFFDDLVKDHKIDSNSVPKDPLSDSNEVLELYKNKDYENIIQHNISDLIKQYFILKNRISIRDKYYNKLDDNGWFKE